MALSRRASLTSLGVAAVVAAGGLALVFGPGVNADDHAAGATTTSLVAPSSTVAPTTTAVPVTTTVAPTTTVRDDGTLRQGDATPAVLDLQQKLTAIGYWLGTPDGSYGRTTQQAVMAFQKANGLSRDGSAGPTTLAALATASRPQAPGTADGVDVDLGRQLLFIVKDGQTLWAINTSTGKPSTPTAPGDFQVTRQIDGMRHAPDGDLYRPKYFNAGDAIHGSPSIPGYAASHGCARVSNAAIDFLWSSGLVPVGTPVRVR